MTLIAAGGRGVEVIKAVTLPSIDQYYEYQSQCRVASRVPGGGDIYIGSGTYGHSGVRI